MRNFLEAIGPASVYWSLFGVVVSLFLGRAILNWQKKRDKLQFLQQAWHEAQLINLTTLSSDQHLVMFEKLIYGDGHLVDVDRARRYFHIFLLLNRVQHHHFAMELGVFTKPEFEAYVRPTLKLLRRQEKVVSYLLKERGYSETFRNELERLLAATTPAEPSAEPSASPAAALATA